MIQNNIIISTRNLYFLYVMFWNYYTDNLNCNKVFVTKIVEWTINDVEKWGKVVFCINDEKGQKSFFWLKKQIYLKDKNIFILDNHNYALWCWFWWYKKWIIDKWANFFHIDQHSDMQDNYNKFSFDFSLEEMEEFVVKKTSVWNFIKPAISTWLIFRKNIILTEYSVLNTDFVDIDILDIDLDFFDPKMWIEDYVKIISILKKNIDNSKIVTIATSPYFLSQDIAIKILNDLI